MMSYQTLLCVLKGGAGSGNFSHSGRPGKVGGSAGDNKVWQGVQQAAGAEKLSKLQAGAIGEQLAMKVLSDKFGVPFETLNVGINNAPIDVGGDHMAVEVKTGIATNGPTAQHWRATIGQPGKEETELLKQMTAEEKRAHNQYKSEQILQRKTAMLQKLAEIAGSEVKPLTVGVILSADGKRGDVFAVPGFHLRLPWATYATDEYHLGTYNIE